MYLNQPCRGGIPSENFKEGDIVNVDVTAFKDGWHGDTSKMFKIGEVSIKAEKLITATYDELMMKAISIVKDGLHLGDIGSAIQTVMSPKNFRLFKILWAWNWTYFHKEPNVLHYGTKGTGEKLMRV